MTQPTNHPELGLAHLEALRSDVRDEIKRRIDQRDRYSIQLTLALGAIVAFAFSKDGSRMALVAAPLVSVYFTVLILYSYRVHSVLAKYLREQIEPLSARGAGTPVKIEFETWYRTQATPGIRRWFFIGTLWVLTVLTMTYLLFAEHANRFNEVELWCLTATYLISVILIYWYFRRKDN